MSHKNVEVVQAVFAAWERRDREAALKHLDPEIEVDFTGVSGIPASVGHGSDALQHVIADWLEVWESLEYDPQSFIDGGEHVIVWLRATMRGRGSGAPAESRMAVIYTVREGRVVGIRGYDTLAAAATVAGV